MITLFKVSPFSIQFWKFSCFEGLFYYEVVVWQHRKSNITVAGNASDFLDQKCRRHIVKKWSSIKLLCCFKFLKDFQGLTLWLNLCQTTYFLCLHSQGNTSIKTKWQRSILDLTLWLNQGKSHYKLYFIQIKCVELASSRAEMICNQHVRVSAKQLLISAYENWNVFIPRWTHMQWIAFSELKKKKSSVLSYRDLFCKCNSLITTFVCFQMPPSWGYERAL